MRSEIQNKLGNSVCAVIFLKVAIWSGAQVGRIVLHMLPVSSVSWIVPQTPV